LKNHEILLLTPTQAQSRREGLIDLLVDAVEGGASVNFVWPMTRDKAARWWDAALAGHERGDRLIFTAEHEGGLCGTVQLILAPQENQAFRADLAKMLVARHARRQGLGERLMRAAEDEARRLGRTLLTLDTEAGSAGERLYARLGWTKIGEIPGFATSPDGSRRDAASFFYKAL
jgi:GNAT superfamily N-acetyltransferase